ncbi:hypothetical protein V490_05846 [Pseudogymnoascus sp. VKM F-3557]|nr:hypothetical protein V490_05846 [Pseudogymnoascus sp. VKM F-3557]
MSYKGPATSYKGEPLVSAALTAKQDFAMALIEEEVQEFGVPGGLYSESGWGEIIYRHHSRITHAGDILSGMVIRGRLQSAVFGTFMDLCMNGVCSLDSLEHRIAWSSGTVDSECHQWINRMLHVFSSFSANLGWVQDDWGMGHGTHWFSYSMPFCWLGIMIARSFTSLDAVFNTIRRGGRLGPASRLALIDLEERYPPNPAWVADINIYRLSPPYSSRLSGTFPHWLPENIDPSIAQKGVYDGIMVLSKQFHKRLGRAEMHYAAFFDTDKDAENPRHQAGKVRM